jgi:2-polyprenyl-3-methyl-5-hydroxy-6-metoxy-1,4-benzoquinol methylase
MPDCYGLFLYLITGGIQMHTNKATSFNFGVNWHNYSAKYLDETELESALKSLAELVGVENITDKSILDIGCGSGIFTIAASKLGAIKVVGIDISKESIETSLSNKHRFLPDGNIEFLHKSVFDENIRQLGTYDMVYSWGVLHHTGDMWRAIDISSKMVAAKGLYVIAIYNKHWSSTLWTKIKYLYNISPAFVQKLMVYSFAVIIAIAKFMVTGKNPFKKKRRGMSFYYDVVDWLGGYPYQYASKAEIKKFMEAKKFELIKVTSPAVPTGCNEFLFLNKNL